MEKVKEVFDPGRTRTYNLLLRRQTRYPLRHWTMCPNLRLLLQEFANRFSRLFADSG